MRASFADIAGARTRLLQAGSGAPLLLVHGLGTTADRWVRNIDALGSTHSVFAPDLLGAGFTADPPPNSDPPQKQHVLHLEALADSLGFGQYAVVGSSYGGLLAALLHLRNPKRVTRLIVIGSGSALHPPEDQRRTLEAARANGTRAFEEGTLEATHARMRALVHDPASTPAETLLLQLVANAQPGRAQAMRRIYAGLLDSTGNAEWQSYPQLERICAPTLLITGRNDVRASWAHAQRASARIPGSSLLVYEACGHAPMLEHPERFNSDAAAFLKQKTTEAACRT
jgi:2-hydroxy-6-oxonona-2,4-dienedioate hydrolase